MASTLSGGQKELESSLVVTYILSSPFPIGVKQQQGITKIARPMGKVYQ